MILLICRRGPLREGGAAPEELVSPQAQAPIARANRREALKVKYFSLLPYSLLGDWDCGKQSLQVEIYFFAGLHTTCPLSFSNVLSPIPLTFLRSSTVLNGRADTISLAVLAPIPGSVISSFSVAVLISTGLSGFLAAE